MIEVRLFATLRQGREKIIMLESETVSTVGDILRKLDIPAEEVSILLVNDNNKKTETPLQDGDIVALFPPVGGG